MRKTVEEKQKEREDVYANRAVDFVQRALPDIERATRKLKKSLVYLELTNKQAWKEDVENAIENLSGSKSILVRFDMWDIYK